jgi:hypothetical protein
MQNPEIVIEISNSRPSNDLEPQLINPVSAQNNSSEIAVESNRGISSSRNLIIPGCLAISALGFGFVITGLVTNFNHNMNTIPQNPSNTTIATENQNNPMQQDSVYKDFQNIMIHFTGGVAGVFFLQQIASFALRRGWIGPRRDMIERDRQEVVADFVLASRPQPNPNLNSEIQATIPIVQQDTEIYR